MTTYSKLSLDDVIDIYLEYEGKPPKIGCVRLDGQSKERVIYNMMGIGTGKEFTVHNNDIETALRGVFERQFCIEVEGQWRPPYEPIMGAFNPKSPFFTELKKQRCFVPRLSEEKFLSTYRGLQLIRYTKAFLEIYISGLKSNDANVCAFVKTEKVDEDKDGASRIISPRNPRYGAALGVYIKAIEPVLFKAINRIYGEVTILKGYSVEDLGKILRKKWDKFSTPVAVGLDAKRFDQSVRVPALKREHAAYALFNNSAKLKKLLKRQLKTKTVLETPNGKLVYVTEGGRSSGDMNTTTGNCELMCDTVYDYFAEATPLSIDEFSLANNGDDCVIFVDAHNLHWLDGIPDWFLRRGFRMAIEEPVYEFELVEFCQTQPVFDGVNWICVRQPKNALAKDCLNINCMKTEGEWNFQRKANSDCGLALYGNMPVFGAYYACLGRNIGKITKSYRRLDGLTYLFDQAQGKPSARREPTAMCRASFFTAFDITPDEQVALEREYDAIMPKYNSPSPVVRFNYNIAAKQFFID